LFADSTLDPNHDALHIQGKVSAMQMSADWPKYNLGPVISTYSIHQEMNGTPDMLVSLYVPFKG
jgi:hypothetical protein